MRQTQSIHLAIKRLLKQEGRTYEDVADYLGISTSNVKRLFAKHLLSLERIESLCDWLNIDFVELAHKSRLADERITQLTLAQEKKLMEEPKLFLVCYMLLNHWTRQEIDDTFNFSKTEMTRMLIKLDRMGLIEHLPLDRVRLLTARNFAWNPKGPVAQFLKKTVLKEFMQSDFIQPGEKIEFISGMLSKTSVETAHQLLEDLAQRFDTLIANDLKLSTDERYGVSLLCGLRPWEFSEFAKHRKGPPKGQPAKTYE